MTHWRSYSLLFHRNHCFHCNIWLLSYHSKLYIHTYYNPCKTVNRFSVTASSNPKKQSNIIHKQPLTCQR